MDDELRFVLINAIPMIAGWRYFGREFWPQFVYAVVLTTFLLSRNFEQTQGAEIEWWRIAMFASISAGTAWSIYAMDKRFKLSHWEKNPE